jgi:hypothetical protein
VKGAQSAFISSLRFGLDLDPCQKQAQCGWTCLWGFIRTGWPSVSDMSLLCLQAASLEGVDMSQHGWRYRPNTRQTSFSSILLSLWWWRGCCSFAGPCAATRIRLHGLCVASPLRFERQKTTGAWKERTFWDLLGARHSR